MSPSSRCGTARASRTRTRAGRQAADGAAERGLNDDALAPARTGLDLPHDLVAGDEGVGERREVQRGLAGIIARSEPQIPVSRGLTGSQPRPGRADGVPPRASRAVGRPARVAT